MKVTIEIELLEGMKLDAINLVQIQCLADDLERKLKRHKFITQDARLTVSPSLMSFIQSEAGEYTFKGN